MKKIIFILFAIIILNTNIADASVITQNIANGCDFTESESNLYALFNITDYECSAGYYLPKKSEECAICPNGYTCSGGTYAFSVSEDQGIVANNITIIWHGATPEAVAANNAGTVVYGGDIRTPQSYDPAQVPVGKHFVGWKFRKTVQN